MTFTVAVNYAPGRKAHRINPRRDTFTLCGHAICEHWQRANGRTSVNCGTCKAKQKALTYLVH